MSLRVVHFLEVVQVQQHHRAVFAAARAGGAGLLHVVDDEAPGGQAGELVVQRHLPCLLLGLLALGDVGAQRDVLDRRTVVRGEGHDRRLGPEQGAIPGAVADFAGPDLPALNGGVDMLVELRRMHARARDRQVPADEVAAAVAGDVAEPVITCH